MQKYKAADLKDGWLRLIGTPAVAFMNVFILSMWEPATEGIPMSKTFWVNMIVVGVTWHLCRVILVWSRIKYPNIETFWKRVFIGYGCYFVISFVIVYTYYVIMNLTNFYNIKLPTSYFVKYMVIGMSQVAIVAAIYEAIYFFALWKQSLQSIEQLKRDTLQSQLDNAKGQINPEFLFSNLGTLTMLIRNRNNKTSKFVDELAQVYRYVLQGTDKQLTELSDELRFISTYEYLLKEKYGEAIQFEVSVPDSHHKLRIPTLTMQILIENALRNFAVSANRPLKMKFVCDGNQTIVISHTLEKSDVTEGALHNIKERYLMLGSNGIQIERTETQYKVTLPLLNQIK